MHGLVFDMYQRFHAVWGRKTDEPSQEFIKFFKEVFLKWKELCPSLSRMVFREN